MSQTDIEDAREMANHLPEGDTRLTTLRKRAAEHGLENEFADLERKHLRGALVDSSRTLAYDLRKMIERQVYERWQARKNAQPDYTPRRRFVPEGAWFNQKEPTK